MIPISVSLQLVMAQQFVVAQQLVVVTQLVQSQGQGVVLLLVVIQNIRVS
jgi:hypothetical protein